MLTSNIYLDEGVDYTYTANHSKDTTGLTLTAKAFDASGTATTLGTASGAASDTDMPIACSISALTPGRYAFEVWVDLGGPNQDLIDPDENDFINIFIVDRKGVPVEP